MCRRVIFRFFLPAGPDHGCGCRLSHPLLVGARSVASQQKFVFCAKRFAKRMRIP
jgi:hypothetical protein